MRWVNVQEIYADGKHNAWPDICRWQNRYYVTFNSGGVGHSNGHSICLLSSTDGERWEKVIERAPQWNGLYPPMPHAARSALNCCRPMIDLS